MSKNHGTKNQRSDQALKALFGTDAHSESPLAHSGAGVRFTGIDLCRPLTEDQVDFLLDALSRFRIVCIAGQDLARFSLAHFERFANHWGAPIPHPSNLMRGGKPAQQDGPTDGPIELIPRDKRAAAAVDQVFPGRLQCMPHDSPTVLVVSNAKQMPDDAEPKVTAGGAGWSEAVVLRSVAVAWPGNPMPSQATNPRIARLTAPMLMA